MVRVLKLAAWFLIGSFLYGLWLRLKDQTAPEEVIDLQEDAEGKFGVI